MSKEKAVEFPQESNLDARIKAEIKKCENSVAEVKVKMEKLLFEHFTADFNQPMLYLPMQACFTLGSQFVELDGSKHTEEEYNEMVLELAKAIQDTLIGVLNKREEAGLAPYPFELIYYALSSVAYSNLQTNLVADISSSLGGQSNEN